MPDWLAEGLYWAVLIALETAWAGLIWFYVGSWVEKRSAEKVQVAESEGDEDDDSDEIRDEIRALTKEVRAARLELKKHREG